MAPDAPETLREWYSMSRANPLKGSFATRLIAWQRRHGRKGLPWQGTRDPYRIWLSEIMLQQTQVAAVIPYYERFLKRFPDLAALAAAPQDEVLKLWSGLGYYARGRNLHAAAQRLVTAHGGAFPRSAAQIAELPGIGRSTAAAVAAFAFDEPGAILDGNVKRVLARYFGVEGWPGARAVEAKLWALAEHLAPGRGIAAYTQAMMDLGATLCTRTQPRCAACPLRSECVALRTARVTCLPAPRPRKPLPLRSATWLVVRHAGQVLLEQRPGAGLWGGLWTFPELSGQSAAAYCRERLGCETASRRRLEPLEHGFTHFRLEIRPVLCEVFKRTSRAETPGRIWIAPAEALDAAVPTPVRRLLRALA
jgi:A/G-specific adenine glycosylase